MKQKLFSIFCCLLLSASMVTQAQELLAPKKQAHPLVLKSANAPTKAPTATNRHNASQEDEYDVVYNYEWSEYAGLFCNQSGTNYRYAGFRWTAGADFMFDLMTVFAKSTQQGFRSPSNSQLYFPQNGTYSVLNGTYKNTSYVPGGNSGVCTQMYTNGQCQTSYTSSFSIWGELLGASAEWYDFIISGGSVSIQYGANQRPYLEADVTSSSYGSWAFFLTVGRLFGFDLQATNGSIDMVDNDDNAHYYSNDQHYGFSAGTSATLTAKPNTGYEFDHWEYNGQNYGNTNPLNWSVASGDDTYNGNTDGYIHLTAVFRAVASGVDVTLNSNGGSNNNQVVSATNGSAMPTTLKAGGAIAKPSRSGYTFGGYYANNDGTGKQYYTATLTSANNWDKTVATTIYAKWTQTVTLNANTANHGSGSNRSATATVNGTALSSFTATTAASGYTLEGYYTDATSGTKVLNANGTYAANNVTNYITNGKWTKTGATTLYAHMTAHTYNVVFNGNGSTDGSMSNQSHTYGSSKALTTNAFTRTGHTFQGWATSQANADAGTVTYTDGQSVSNLTTTNNGTYNLYAVWTELVTFTIASYTNGTVTVTPDDGSGAFTSGSRDLAVGTIVNFSAVANANYHITNVNLNIKGSDNSFSASSAYKLRAGDGMVTLTADFLPDTYAITYNKGANGTGADIAAGEKTYNEEFTLSSSTFTRTGYTQKGWSTTDGGEKAYNLGGSYTTNSAQEFFPYWSPNTNTAYTVKHYQQNLTLNGYTEVVDDRQNLTGTTATATAAEARTYTGFTAQSFNQETIAANGSTVVSIYYNRDKYTVTVVKNENAYGTLSGESENIVTVTNVPYGTEITTSTNTVTINGTQVAANKHADDAQYTYSFTGWTKSPNNATVMEDMTITANFTRTTNTYNLTWNFNGGTTTDDYINGSVEWGTPITAPTPTKDGCTFAGWDITPAATMPAATTTYTAQWTNCTISALTLEDNRDAAYYNTFKTNYDDVDVETVTYSRTFRANTWSTVCLPFYVDEDNLSGAGWLGSVYEFKHAEGTANVDDGLYLNFYPAREMQAGKGYLVYSRGADLNGNFEFIDVTIDTDADTEPTITDLVGYNDGQGTITLVGTLRQGTLTPNATSQMALKDNMVWYPGSGTTTIRAYRGFFKDSSGSPIPPRVHIVVEGEVVTDLEIMENGELRMDNDNVRKYMDNGVLIIERNGIRYDAQGKRIEN